MEYLDIISGWFLGALNDGWSWVRSLTYQEWFVFLGVTSAMGFMCMRGYGSRSEY